MKLGVTGGIGSGKTSVCRVFKVLGVPVFSADEEARIIMESDISIINEINAITGKEMYTNGVLNRSELARLIFSNRDLLNKINHTVHPAVRQNFLIWEKSQDSDYVILEAAILFESGAAKIMDRILTVIAPLEERIERVIRRNSLSREQIMERVANQSDDGYKITRSDYIIDNADNKMIIPEIIRIHNEIKEIINSGNRNG
jgi:dephospho-CoA kinase